MMGPATGGPSSGWWLIRIVLSDSIVHRSLCVCLHTRRFKYTFKHLLPTARIPSLSWLNSFMCLRQLAQSSMMKITWHKRYKYKEIGLSGGGSKSGHFGPSDTCLFIHTKKLAMNWVSYESIFLYYGHCILLCKHVSRYDINLCVCYVCKERVKVLWPSRFTSRRSINSGT